ncbi:unnamed protein product [Vicia faba]|uniref:Uncharacterized protein n=1 Tax=Vicia faba TaxID=3906 RepID=A0AAV0ZNT9_VICFA|nr:unnamed protein product [Vicia faba]
MLVRIYHWSTRILSYTRRIQLVKSVLFSISNYWLQIFPLPNKVLAHVESHCRKFLWNGTENYTRKAPISWDHVYDPIVVGGMKLISLKEWNKATMGKILWNIHSKKDKLWISLIHKYHMKKEDASNYQPKGNCLRIVKAIFKQRSDIMHSIVWNSFRRRESM